MWCVPEITTEFIDRMEDVLRLYARKYDPKEPVVCLDERPVVLREDAQVGQPMRPGRMARTDYEYVRCGTANIYCTVEPADQTTADLRNGQSQGARLRVGAEEDRATASLRAAHSSGDGQPQHPPASR
jgi:hypothetical protein